jgi:hypothetical protein
MPTEINKSLNLQEKMYARPTIEFINLTFPAKSEDSSERWCYDRVNVMTEME